MTDGVRVSAEHLDGIGAEAPTSPIPARGEPQKRRRWLQGKAHWHFCRQRRRLPCGLNSFGEMQKVEIIPESR
ncbi:MAG: hypothetical protein IKD72_10495 [Clostridia bacterium]|nr:hypothetical protein [Clostridia bacterium]